MTFRRVILLVALALIVTCTFSLILFAWFVNRSQASWAWRDTGPRTADTGKIGIDWHLEWLERPAGAIRGTVDFGLPRRQFRISWVEPPEIKMAETIRIRPDSMSPSTIRDNIGSIRPLWAGLVINWIVFFALAIVLHTTVRFLSRLDERFKAQRLRDAACCIGCGYNLTSNQSGVCPECGVATAEPIGKFPLNPE